MRSCEAAPDEREVAGLGRLWRDPDVFLHRIDHTAATLAAVAGSAAQLPDLLPDQAAEGERFARLHGQVTALGPDVLGAVCGDPYAHFWAQTAFALAAAIARDEPLPRRAEAYARELGTTDARAIFSAHLRQYGRLAVGAALVSGTDLALPAPLRVRLPTAVPALPAALVGNGEVDLLGVVEGSVDTSAGRLEPIPTPIASVPGCELPLQPHGYAAPGIGWSPAAGRTTIATQERHRDLVERALLLVARHLPDALEPLDRFIRWVAINPVDDMTDANFVSDSNLLGSFAVLGIDNPWVVASATIHELHHNRLFCIEELDGFLAGERLGTHDGAVYYSPWRDEPRPLRGLLHGLYVYVPEARFWQACAASSDTPPPALQLARDRVVRIRLQQEIALFQLERYGRFTARGHALFRQLASDTRRTIASARELVPGDTPATYIEIDGTVVPRQNDDGTGPMTSRQVAAQHLTRFDRLGQIRDVDVEALAGARPELATG
jgi:HEXXH motif-containing protein